MGDDPTTTTDLRSEFLGIERWLSPKAFGTRSSPTSPTHQTTEEEISQGGPASPLLATILLDDLDKELERRGLPFVPYADDCAIFAKSERAAQRIMESVTQYLTKQLREDGWVTLAWLHN